MMEKINFNKLIENIGGYTPYASRWVRILKVYEENPEKHSRTFEYQFKGQNGSKLLIPTEICDKLQYGSDDEGNSYVAVDNKYIKIVTTDNWKRLVLVSSTNSTKEEVE